MNAASLLRYSRARAGLTQRELAERTGIRQPGVARIEAGHVSPRVDTLSRLLMACGVRLDGVPRRGEGVDRTAIRELLALSPEERLRRAAAEARNLADFESAVHRNESTR
ncbi:MAG TPA: helix-turn-helix transcriptional regulator [Gemmatimonadota bacterium]|nr:helix-turn-helix transcriptional regulator [Gemmatimonadota bacterium]